MGGPRDSFRVLSNILMTCMCMIDDVTMYSSRHDSRSGKMLASVNDPVKHGNNHDDGECHNAIVWNCYYLSHARRIDYLLILLPVTGRLGGKRNSTVVKEIYERAICIPVNTACSNTTSTDIPHLSPIPQALVASTCGQADGFVLEESSRRWALRKTDPGRQRTRIRWH